MRLVLVSLIAVAAVLDVSIGTTSGQPAEPAKPEAVVQAETLFREGKGEEAWKRLQEAVKKHPQLPPARLMLARLQFAVGMGSVGRASLEQAAIEEPNHPEVYLTNASQALAEGRLIDTIMNCQVALAQAGADRWTAEQKNSFRREARAGLSAAFEARKDWETARTHLLAWLELEPKNGGVRQRLARALLMLGRETEAVNELEQATKDDAALEPAEVTMGRLWSLKGDAKQAEDWLQKAVQKYPREARVHRAFGGWLLDRGRVEAARLHIDTAVKLEPKSRESLGLKGLLARYLKDYAEAIRIFDEIVREEPGNFFAGNHLALACVELPEKQQRAVQLAEVNARQYPRLADALATLGWVYLRAGRLDDADQALSAAASGGQISSDTAYYLARLLRERKKPGEARELLKTALATEGPFVNRDDATKLFDELVKATAEPTKSK